MTYSIKSRKLKKVFDFYRPGKYYIYVDTTGHNPGTLGQQICAIGYIGMGETLGYGGDSQQEFNEECRKWYRAHMRLRR